MRLEDMNKGKDCVYIHVVWGGGRSASAPVMHTGENTCVSTNYNCIKKKVTSVYQFYTVVARSGCTCRQNKLSCGVLVNRARRNV